MRVRVGGKDGSVLWVVLIFTMLLSVTCVAYLSLVGSQHTFSTRSQRWNSALVMAESGIEEGMTHANFSGTTNLISNGWSVTGTNVTKTRTFGSDRYTVTMSTSTPPVLTSQGYAQTPLQTNSYISRTVQVQTTNVNMVKGLISKTTLTMTGGGVVNSYDSCNSTNHAYNPSNFNDNGYAAVLSGVPGALALTTVYGSVATGPGGSAVVSGAGVGTKSWLSTSPGTIQPGHIRNDANMSLGPVPVPFTTGYSAPNAGTVNGTNYTYALSSGDYYYSGNMAIGGGQKMIITGNARLYTSGDFTISGSGFAVLATNATLDLYVAGTATVSGSGIFNNTQMPSSLHLYGLPTCARADITGSAMFVGIIYAPSAALTISGSAGAAGSAAANTIVISGGASFHCDSCLYSSGARYAVSTWTEL